MLALNDYDEIFGEDYNEKVLLQMGAPGPNNLRKVADILKESTAQKFVNFEDRSEETLQYGCLTGNKDFKIELAKFLSECYRNPVDSDDLFVNNGSSQGVSELLSWFFLPGDSIFVTDLTYKTIITPLKDSELNVVTISCDDDGICVEEFEQKLNDLPKDQSISERYPFRAAVYIIPVFNNPTSGNCSQDRCQKIVKLARKHNLMIICDDVYNILSYSAPDCNDPLRAKPPTRLFWLDNKNDPGYVGNVISVGTFSKILAPGLRLGWFEMPKSAMKSFCQSYCSVSGSGRNPYTSGIVTESLKLGLVRKHVKDLKLSYSETLNLSHKIITSSLSKYGVTCKLPEGGIFLWVVLPSHTRATDVQKISKDVSFLPGEKCCFSGSYCNCMRISISFYEPEILYPAMRKLCDCIIKVIERAKNGLNSHATVATAPSRPLTNGFH